MTGWAQLGAELDLWHAADRTATFWWRDDDAIQATAELDRLVTLRTALDVPLAIAAIPARAERSLVEVLGGEDDVSILQHGYAHVSHSAVGGDKIELGGRPPTEVTAELATGRCRLDDLFGPALLPVMVPPWNRIDGDVIPLLPGLGYEGLSMFSARAVRLPGPGPGLVMVNTHVDIIDWPHTRAFCGEAAALGAATGHLAARRLGDLDGTVDGAEPTGLLTHHLAHDKGCWEFIEEFVKETAAFPAVRWVGAREAFGMAP